MTHSVTVVIRDGALNDPPPEMACDRTGAILHFRGIVRRTEQDQQIHGLDYAAYQPMAERTLEQLAKEAIERFGLLAIHMEHSRGFVPVGGCSFELVITSSHRREALDAMDWFIDRLKQIVPIWKQPVFVDASPAGAPQTRNHSCESR